MKKISFLVACYNEVENVVPLSSQLLACMEKELPQYDYELLFIDNRSTDGTRELLEQLCTENKKIKAIFNIANFGQMRSPVHGMKQTTGDCTIKLCADFQDPIEMIPAFVNAWEKGAHIVIGIKIRSKENKLIYLLRSFYYRIFNKLSNIQHIHQFTGFGLYDRSFMDIVHQIDDPIPYFRGIVAEFSGNDRVEIPYVQPKRKAGTSKNNLLSLYDIAMTAMTTYSKGLMRLSVLFGGICALVSLLVGLIYTVYKLLNWNTFSAGIAPMVIGVFLLGGIQLIFIGVLGEYILTINARTIRRPLVIEEKRINFDV
ncbi:MAG: glycosyltransferase family 2 protein [Eubacteriales bacterium]|nr:glycosyltransferase family 2 protein [Eubacteriales bacterium]